MKNKSNKGWERISTAVSALQYKKVVKGMSITYGVVWNLFLLFIVVAMIGGAFAGGVGAGYFASLVKDEKVRAAEALVKDLHQYEETSTIYFAKNKLLGKLRADIDREEVKVDEISDYLKKAVVATEDEYFYEHKGVVPKALFRAVFQEFTNSAVQSGGSTLTQQLIKNQILTNEVSFDRKAKEVLLALRVERFLEKDAILEAYLNVSTFGRNSSGQNIGGVQAAAQGIFGVDAKELNLPQSAFIAGLPQSPFGYTPFTNKGEIKSPEMLEPGLNRMKTVLKRMLREGYISEKEYKKAVKYDITADFIPKQPRAFEEYPALTFEIEERAIKVLMEVLAKNDGYKKKDLEKNDKLYGKYWTLANRDIRQNGYEIHTTINKKIYDIHQKTKDAYQNYGPTLKRQRANPETGEMETVDDPVQIGAILIENKTGKILSFVGGRDFELEAMNHATQAKRQNGSTMKPLLVYGPAMELGASAPGSVVADVPIAVPNGAGKTKVFGNYVDGRYYGLVSTRYALAQSYNASAISTYSRIIDQKPTKFLEKMGISTLDPIDHVTYSAALGGLTHGVTVEENTNAFTTFTNGGKFIDAYMIDKITDHQGNIIYKHKVKKVNVFSPQTAYLMIDVMRDVFKYGTAASLPGMLNFSADWAGKTGTSNNHQDSWLVASNPNVTFGTWIGYTSNSSLYSQSNPESLRNYRIWANLMNAAYDVAPDIVKPKESFKMPGGIVNRSYCAVSGLLPSEACSKAGLVQTDIFNAKFVPTKVDDSLGSGRYVIANGRKYMALASTPAEFSHQGALLDPDFVKRITNGMVTDVSQLIPDNPRWKNILVADAKLHDDGKAPAAVKASISGSTISWSPSSSNDVIGYRVYSSTGKKVGSIIAGSSLSQKVGKGSFYVVAVDVAGRESKPSNNIGIVEEEKKPDDKEVTAPVEDKKKDETKQKDDEKKIAEDKKKAEEKQKQEEAKKKQEEEKKKQEEEAKKEKEKEKKKD
ncbi:transglycosylase domain-containing protein [Lederbergia citrea]|uniref:Penicillin-binding protein n=1 Tax=Lederbergia citrea TaxID=2833581 RepID=A0A942Z5C5_9BACI|nr:transglycosylase domain-containing protein [Lederbergia citrea]MBS4176007.1 penicillin-binding protein [Lederbergia citrea]MBS4202568.1 penicillin-binding protein [Lederbergia citrea]MBS4222766.1 penicillin-binding protein [Lederbergia citrea]